jgi:uncharacterized membrane protein
MFQLTLEQGAGVLTMLGVGLGALLLAALFYRRAFAQLTPSQCRILYTLRAVAIVLVVLLLFRPVLGYRGEDLHRRGLILLVDRSASMGTADDAKATTRFARARGRVLDWWGKLEGDFDLRLLEFSDHAVAVGQPGDLLDRKPDGPATNLIRALQTAAKQFPRGDVEAVVLLSDGIHNSAGDPVETARKLGLVVHTVGVGNSLRDSHSYRDIQVTGLECAEQLPVNNQAKLTASVEGVGMAGRVVKVHFDQDGQPLGEAELVLDGAEGAQEVSFPFVPTVKGRHTYTARVPVANNEKIKANNQRSAHADVLDARIRVLYVEGTLRAEYGALVQRFLSRDPDLEFCALVQTRPNVFVQRTNIKGLELTGIPSEPAILAKFDVFVIGDLDSTYLTLGQMEQVVERVRAGAGLLMLGGYHGLGPGGYDQTPIGKILPVSVGDRAIGQANDSFLPVLTPDGRSHPIFANIASFFPSSGAGAEVKGLPPLLGCAKVARAQPGARVLAIHPTEKDQDGKPMPVLAIQPVGKGRTAVFTGDTTRNWQQVLRALDQRSPFTRFWGQMTRWLAGQTAEVKAEANIVARTDKAAYEPGAPIEIQATVRDQEGEGANQAAVTARIQPPQGEATELPLTRVSGPAGHYHGIYTAERSGTYRILVRADLEEQSLKADPLLAEVGRPNLEFDRLDLDDKTLARIAEATGGRYRHLSTADHLLDELNREKEKRDIHLQWRLYWPPLFWVVFVGVLATEWTLRRRYRLR